MSIQAEQVLKGINVEMEHTTDREIAKKIAMDHLNEDPIYYDKLEQAMPGEIKIDPRGPGAVEDMGEMRNGQPNIIDYSNKEPLLFQAGENSSHDYPGKIVINNEPERDVDREVKHDQTGTGTAATGESQPLNDITQPTIPTGGPQIIPPGIENNKHGDNFNHNLNDNITINPPEAERKTNEEEIKMQPFAEAEFNEGDHPRAPEGSDNGGQFVSSDSGIPQGKTPADKKAREDFFAPYVDDNKKLQELRLDIMEAQLDAGLARVRKEADNEAEAEEKITKLKTEQDALYDKLKDSGKLEGTEAQAALLEIDRLNAEAAKKKPGSKGELKLKQDAAIMRFRLDLIRRGKIADKDIRGNPTNKAAKDEEQVRDIFKAQMEKPIIKATKNDLKGFDGNPKIKLGSNVSIDAVNDVKSIWNGLDASERKFVDNMMIRGSRAKGKITAGEWMAETGTMEVTTHPTFTKKDYEETIMHEVGHVKFKQYPAEKVAQWNAAVKDISPPTKYAAWHRDRVNNYKMTVRFKEEDRPIVMSNIEKLTNLYYEEIHSEVISHKRSGLGEQKVYSKSGLEAAVKAYDEVFS